MSVADAERIGLNYRAGQVVHMNTANGVSQGWLTKLSAVRLGTVDVYEVDAVVSSGSMPKNNASNSGMGTLGAAALAAQMQLSASPATDIKFCAIDDPGCEACQ